MASSYVAYAKEFLEDNTPAQAKQQITDELNHAQQKLDDLKTDASRATDKAKFLTSHKAQMDGYMETITRAKKAISYLNTKIGGRRRRTGKKSRKNMTRRRR